METIQTLLGYFLHIDQYLQALITYMGPWIYVLLFAIIFCETGLIIMPFLPGDSLLFAAGTLAGIGAIDIHLLAVTLVIAALLGDTVNYAAGHWIGPKIFQKEDSFFFKKDYLNKTHSFYQRYGGKTIIIARFIPIIRTFAPFIAGVGTMRYKHFLLFNITGGILWIYGLLYISYFFGNIPFIQKNFSWVIVAIILISITPPILEYMRQFYRREREH